MRFMLDENVAVSVSKVFKNQGYDCEFIRNLVPAGSVDPLVAYVSEDHGAILVSHDGDFQNIAPRIPNGQKKRFSKLSRIWLCLDETQTASRVSAVFDFIKFEFNIAQTKQDKRMILKIGKSFIRSER
jgi:predicted nuclease of predicted toxin-antitoxin system